MINKQRMLEEFISLVKVSSPTRKERELADILKNKLEKLTLDVTEDQAGLKIQGNSGNIIGFLRGNTKGRSIAFSAHMDCVEPCSDVKPQIKDGTITSDGSTVLGSDDKAGIAAVLEVLQVIQEKNLPHGDIWVLFTAAEEGGLNGSSFADVKKITAEYCYVLDSSGQPGKIITAAPGQNNLEFVIHGKAAHAGIAPENGINAIVAAAKAIVSVQQGRIDPETTANIGYISGGVATNIVPDCVSVRCEVRSRNEAKLEEYTERMINSFCKEVEEYGASIEVKRRRAYSPYTLDNHSPMIQLLVQAAEDVGITPELTITGGGSDANNFNENGLASTVLGVGMTNVHTKDEYIKEADLYKSAEWVLAMIQRAVHKPV